MARYIITGLKSEVLNKKAGGTWTKISIKTNLTGDQVLELGYGIPNKDKIAVGSEIEGYTEKKQWGEKNGEPLYNVRLNGITVEYVYAMLLSLHPELKDFQLTPEPKKVEVAKPAATWQTAPVTVEPTIKMEATDESDPQF
jgi:hypothetical protein